MIFKMSNTHSQYSNYSTDRNKSDKFSRDRFSTDTKPKTNKMLEISKNLKISIINMQKR